VSLLYVDYTCAVLLTTLALRIAVGVVGEYIFLFCCSFPSVFIAGLDRAGNYWNPGELR
jgi:hypothetical protein